MPTTLPSDALTTRTKVKSFLGITDTSSDTLIDELITGATQLIKSYCGGRSFISQSYSEIYDTFRFRRKIFLRQRPVISLTSVEYRSGVPSNPTWNTYNADSYLLYAGAGYIHFYAQLPEIPQGLRINYTAGFLIDFTQEFDSAHHTLPEDLTLACNMLVARLKNKAKSQGISQETTEGQSISYSMTDMGDEIKSIISKYKYFSLSK